jgi:hypothetical protein
MSANDPSANAIRDEEMKAPQETLKEHVERANVPEELIPSVLAAFTSEDVTTSEAFFSLGTTHLSAIKGLK